MSDVAEPTQMDGQKIAVTIEAPASLIEEAQKIEVETDEPAAIQLLNYCKPNFTIESAD
jgi:hypothetical protein